MPATMQNSIEKFQKYTSHLDEVYSTTAKTAVFDSDSQLVKLGDGGKTMMIPVMSMSGLADYDRNTGYAQGAETLDLKPYPFDYDRGRKFSIDVMDNEETAGVAFGQLASQFMRTHVVPEMDAYHIGKYAAKAGHVISIVGAQPTAEQMLRYIGAMLTAQENAGVPSTGKYLLIPASIKFDIEQLDTYKSRAVLGYFDGIIALPAPLCYTAFKLLDGRTDGQIQGGFSHIIPATYTVTTTQPADWSTTYGNYYTKSGSTYTHVSGSTAPTWTAGTYYEKSGVRPIYAMIVQKDAVMQFTKHLVDKTIPAENNPDADADLFFYRAYGISDVLENKRNGVSMVVGEVIDFA